MASRFCLFFFSAILTFSLGIHPAWAKGPDSHRLAVLIGVPHKSDGGDQAQHNDLSAFREALVQRGYEGAEIIVAEGELNKQQLAAFLQSVRDRISSWDSGQVFLYYSGHGDYVPPDATTVDAAEPGLQLQDPPDSQLMLWKELFSALGTPPKVDLVLLPDC